MNLYVCYETQSYLLTVSLLEHKRPCFFSFFLPQLYLFCLITKTQLNLQYKGLKHLIQRTLTVKYLLFTFFRVRKKWHAMLENN